ncbi:tetratricopeptide repeat protein [Phormidium sp. LEGE 05292]|uniref:CHAT domain-containing protein n=1 Tax=[Phormidium] sp. LEGE 05292 TaxID=767427 RepID=UPI001881A9CD|nr:tetratricopeptide repeat protein [Phormidium sp. LEGE 05292]MBE9227035.1 tetratricopeptide repeat protein [Phormidium sp. LEGE 05292]
MRSPFIILTLITAILAGFPNFSSAVEDFVTPAPVQDSTILDDADNSQNNFTKQAEQLLKTSEQLFANRQYQEAINTFKQLREIYQKIGNKEGEAITLFRIGSCYDRLGEIREALNYYQQALVLRRIIGDKSGEGSILNSIGGVYFQQGNYQQALEFYQQTLQIRRQVGDKLGEGRTLNNIGLIYEALADYPRALENYQQALVIFQVPEIRNRQGEAAILNNIGLIYNQLGQSIQALEFYQKALAIRQDIDDKSGVGTTLHNIGYIYDQQGKYSQALEYYQQALQVRKAVSDRSGEALTLNNIGLVYDNLGKYSLALDNLQKALGIFQGIGDRTNEGNTLDSIGTVYKNLRQYQQSLDSYQQALAIIKEVGNRNFERSTLSNIAQLLALQNKPELAILFYKQAVNVTESIRSRLSKLPSEQQRSYTATVADTYRSLADLLLQQNRVLEAQQVLDLLKVQEIEDYLQKFRSDEQNSPELELLPQEQKVQTDYLTMQNKAIELGKELNKLQKIPEANRTPEQQKRIAELIQIQQQIRAEFNNFINSPAVIALTQKLTQTTSGENLNLRTLNKLQAQLKQLSQNAVLLYPLILEDRLELVLVTSYSPPIRRTVNIKRQELNRLIVEFRLALQQANADAKTPANQLYNLLIKPIENDLIQAKTQTIIYAPDGQLRYIPIAALYDGKQWLIERFSINNITSASLTDFNSRNVSQLKILAAAFTQGSYNVTVGTRKLTFAGLPFAGREIENLAAIIPTTTKLIDSAFTPQSTVPRLNEYNIVHLATHAAFVIGQPQDSFILFGDGSRVTLRDVETWSLPNVELVVLSACETGIGGQLGNGEEILGFGYQMQLTGAKATIASLWSVSDGGTQVLMDAFYAELRKGNISKAEALRRAQIALIKSRNFLTTAQRGRITTAQPTRNSLAATVSDRLNHPYYWAAFVLIGNGL